MERTHRISKLLGVTLAVSALILMLLWMQGVLGGGKIPPEEVASGKIFLKEPHTVERVQRTTHMWHEAHTQGVLSKSSASAWPN